MKNWTRQNQMVNIYFDDNLQNSRRFRKLSKCFSGFTIRSKQTDVRTVFNTLFTHNLRKESHHIYTLCAPCPKLGRMSTSYSMESPLREMKEIPAGNGNNNTHRTHIHAYTHIHIHKRTCVYAQCHIRK